MTTRCVLHTRQSDDCQIKSVKSHTTSTITFIAQLIDFKVNKLQQSMKTKQFHKYYYFIFYPIKPKESKALQAHNTSFNTKKKISFFGVNEKKINNSVRRKITDDVVR